MSKNYKWWVVGMLWVVCFFNYADRQAFSAVLPVLQKEFLLDSLQVGWLASAFAWTYAAAAPFAGFIADRLPRKYLILGGCAFWSAVTLATGWCGKFWQLITVRALTGLGESVYFPSAMSLLSDYHGKKSRSLAFSLHQSAVYVGSIGGSWLGAWLAASHGWKMGFYIFGGVGIVLAILLLRVLKEPLRNAAEVAEASRGASEPISTPQVERLGVKETLGVIFSKPTAMLLMAVFLGANFVATIFLALTPLFLVDKFNYSIVDAGLYGALFINLASAISVPLGGILADRFASRLLGGRALVQAIGLFAGTAFVALIGLTDSKTVLCVSLALLGFCKGFYDSNIFAALYDVIEPRARATAAGIMNTIGWGGGALGPLFIMLVTKYGRHTNKIENMSEAIAFGSVIYLVGAGVLVFVALVTIKRDAIKTVPAIA